MKLGEVIRGWRIHQEIGQRELAKEMGLSPSALCRLEAGDDVSCRTLADVMLWLIKDRKEENG